MDKHSAQRYSNRATHVGKGYVARANICVSMLSLGYDPTVVDIRDSQDRSPLHYAATYDHLQSAKILHSYGANMDSIDRDGNTPMIVSASKGANKVLKFLLSQVSPFPFSASHAPV